MKIGSRQQSVKEASFSTVEYGLCTEGTVIYSLQTFGVSIHLCDNIR